MGSRYALARKDGGRPFTGFMAGRRDRGAMDGIFLTEVGLLVMFAIRIREEREVTFGRIIPDWFFKLCENTWPGLWFKQSQWMFAIDETFHIMALGMLIGTLVIVDLRLLGFGMRRKGELFWLSRMASDMNKGTPVMTINATPISSRREITGDLRNGLPPHPETQQTQIDDHQGSNEHA